MSPEDRFLRELEQLRRGSDAAAQFLYSWLAFHKYASGRSPAVTAINKNALFWRTSLGALQTALFITLGRIFDKDPRSHGIDRLLSEAAQNPQIFSRVRQSGREAYVPTPNDFRRLSRYVARKRKIYKAYGRIRNKVFAHNDAQSSQKRDALFGKTQLGELQRLVLSLRAFHEVLWQLYHNGRKPTIRVGKYSVHSMTQDISELPLNAPLEQQVFAQTCRTLGFYVAGAQQSVAGRQTAP